MKKEPLLIIDDLYGGYGRTAVIKGLSMTIGKGDFVGIIGPNGSGKSTFLRLVSGVLRPQKGRITFSGEEIARIRPKSFARRVAFVGQDTAVNFPLTVWEVALMGRIPHLGRLQAERRSDITAAEMALSVTDTAQIKDNAIDSLSAGERQRCFIAKALAQEPSLLLLDEPTSHLDIGHQIMILDLLKRLNRERELTIVVVLHDLNLAGEYCDSLLLLDDGRPYKQGRPEDVLTYQNIEAVYKTVVVVNRNPISSKPCVLLVSGAQLCRHE